MILGQFDPNLPIYPFEVKKIMKLIWNNKGERDLEQKKDI